MAVQSPDSRRAIPRSPQKCGNLAENIPLKTFPEVGGLEPLTPVFRFTTEKRKPTGGLEVARRKPGNARRTKQLCRAESVIRRPLRAAPDRPRRRRPSKPSLPRGGCAEGPRCLHFADALVVDAELCHGLVHQPFPGGHVHVLREQREPVERPGKGTVTIPPADTPTASRELSLHAGTSMTNSRGRAGRAWR